MVIHKKNNIVIIVVHNITDNIACTWAHDQSATRTRRNSAQHLPCGLSSLDTMAYPSLPRCPKNRARSER